MSTLFVLCALLHTEIYTRSIISKSLNIKVSEDKGITNLSALIFKKKKSKPIINLLCVTFINIAYYKFCYSNDSQKWH